MDPPAEQLTAAVHIACNQARSPYTRVRSAIYLNDANINTRRSSISPAPAHVNGIVSSQFLCVRSQGWGHVASPEHCNHSPPAAPSSGNSGGLSGSTTSASMSAMLLSLRHSRGPMLPWSANTKYLRNGMWRGVQNHATKKKRRAELRALQ